jgi:DNA processing protein
MYGIDTQAHQKTLEFGGTTVAVLGGGLNCVYPEENIDLYLQILNSGGLILSEFEPEYKPSLWTFPQRNRIVAGLADEVFVVEAGFKSGSLITANLAYKMGKKVWAVPGMIDSPTSQGTNQLIADNKAVILNNLDILDQKAGAKQENLFDKGSELLMEINSESQTVDQLAKKLKRSIPEISIELTNLVLSGQIEEENGKYYRLRKP